LIRPIAAVATVTVTKIVVLHESVCFDPCSKDWENEGRKLYKAKQGFFPLHNTNGTPSTRRRGHR